MPRFSVDGKAIVARSFRDAAMAAAGTIAQQRYGREGYCRTLRLDNWTEDGLSSFYEAFVGHDLPIRDGGGCQGRNIWLSVHRVED